jgi:hypothetical protein
MDLTRRMGTWPKAGCLALGFEGRRQTWGAVDTRQGLADSKRQVVEAPRRRVQLQVQDEA